MSSQASVSISWVQTLLDAARRQGVDQAALLKAARLRPSALRLERWPIDHITRLWRAAAELSANPSFGLQAGSAVGPGSFNVVSYMLQSAATLREALAVVQKYQRLISDGGRIQLLPAGDASWLVYHPCQGELAFSPHQIEAVLAAVVSFGGWIATGPLQPRWVRFSHARVGPAAAYRKVFGGRVEFEQAFNGMLLDNARLDAPLPPGDLQLARVHDRYAAARLRALHGTQPLPEAVRAWIDAHLGAPAPTRAQTAAALGLSERTLCRRLSDHGTAFADLLDAARRARAQRLVADTALPLRELALDLGFADLTAFHRAFRRWTGTTPARWRARDPARARP